MVSINAGKPHECKSGSDCSNTGPVASTVITSTTGHYKRFTCYNACVLYTLTGEAQVRHVQAVSLRLSQATRLILRHVQHRRRHLDFHWNDILPWLQLLPLPWPLHFRLVHVPSRRCPVSAAHRPYLITGMGNILACHVVTRSSGRDPECGGKYMIRTCGTLRFN